MAENPNHGGGHTSVEAGVAAAVRQTAALADKTSRQLFRNVSMASIKSCPASPSVRRCYRLVVLGSARTGKSSVVQRFLTNSYDDTYTPTIEEFHRKMYQTKTELYELDIVDTSGFDPFPATRRLTLMSGDLFVVVFSVDNRGSYEESVRICDQIVTAKDNDRRFGSAKNSTVPIVVLANKTDIPPQNQQVSAQEAESSMPKYVNFASVSAKNGQGVVSAFTKLFGSARLPKEMLPENAKAFQRQQSDNWRQIFAASRRNHTNSAPGPSRLTSIRSKQKAFFKTKMSSHGSLFAKKKEPLTLKRSEPACTSNAIRDLESEPLPLNPSPPASKTSVSSRLAAQRSDDIQVRIRKSLNTPKVALKQTYSDSSKSSLHSPHVNFQIPPISTGEEPVSARSAPVHNIAQPSSSRTSSHSTPGTPRRRESLDEEEVEEARPKYTVKTIAGEVFGQDEEQKCRLQ